MDVYVGIDVACAKRKPLPICFVSYVDDRLTILKPPTSFVQSVPRGLGNREIESHDPFRSAAQQTAHAFRILSTKTGWNLRSIAIDAPAMAPPAGRRESELALKQEGLQCIWTPDQSAWIKKKESARRFLAEDRALARLPGANEIWMLYGFALFEELRAVGIVEVIEVFPYAIMRTLLPQIPHKTSSDGYSRQLNAIAKKLGWAPDQLEGELAQAVGGAKHDRLDAYMAAWIASLAPDKRRAFGSEANVNDSIWIPNLPILTTVEG